MRSFAILCLLALASSCDPAAMFDPDSGEPLMMNKCDSGTQALDAGKTDSGTPKADAGTPKADAGVVVEPPEEDAGMEPPPMDSGTPDAGPMPKPDAGTPPRCAKEPCTCIRVPASNATACWHSNGGRYAHSACSASYQCCNGKFAAQTAGCGVCTCTEAGGKTGCVAPASGPEVCFPQFEGTSVAVPANVQARMNGKSMKAGCPVGYAGLRYLRMSHWGFDGTVKTGEMVVAAAQANSVLAAFKHLYEMRFPIQRMQLVDDYNANDDASMAANNTSAFNCRPITGGSSFSRHSYGVAIDINPVQNPYISGSTVLPPAGATYTNRTNERQGMIIAPGPVTGAFISSGWTWGGNWSNPKDYQHVEFP